MIILILSIFVIFGISMISFPLQRFEGIAIIIPLLAFMAQVISQQKLEKTDNITMPLKIPPKIVNFTMGVSVMAMFYVSWETSKAWTYYTYVLTQAQRQKMQGLSVTNLQAILNWPILGPRFDLFHLFIKAFPADILAKLNRAEVDYYYRLTSSATPNVPHNIIARLDYLYALGARQEDLAEIINLLDRLENVTGTLYSWHYTMRMQFALIQGNKKQANDYFQKAIKQPIVDDTDKNRLQQLQQYLNN